MTSPILKIKGTRQPQLMKSCWGSKLMTDIDNVPNNRPIEQPIIGILPPKPLFDYSEYSAASSTAPPHSPPTAKPCIRRRVTSNIGAHIPIE